MTFCDVLCEFVNIKTFLIIYIQKTSYNIYLQLTFCDVLCQFVHIITILIMFIQRGHKTFIYNWRFKTIHDIITFLILSTQKCHKTFTYNWRFKTIGDIITFLIISLEKHHNAFIYNCILWRFVIMSEYYNVSNNVCKNISNRFLN